jgi:hypothetical protein
VDQDKLVLLYNASRAVSIFLSHHHYELQADYTVLEGHKLQEETINNRSYTKIGQYNKCK